VPVLGEMRNGMVMEVLCSESLRRVSLAMT
jgi:hypothetical protein